MRINRQHRKYWLLPTGALVCALAVAVLFMFAAKQPYLLLNNEQSGQALLCLPLAKSREFAVSFNHSVNKSPVTEYYRVEEGQIYLESLRYYTFGAGMPSGPEAGQTLRYAEDGAMLIEGYHRQMTDLCYIIGQNTAHTLHWRGEDIPLTNLDAPGQPVLFSVVMLSRWQAFRLVRA